MQGKTQSSLAIWTAFNSMTTAVSRLLRHVLNISWKRVENASSFAVVGTSVVAGVQIVKGLGGSITNLDNFMYYDESEKLIEMSYDRILQEPLGGISSAIMDISLENSDDRFTPDHNQTIGTAILPKRPINMNMGFLVNSQTKTVPIFKGLTKQPRNDYGGKITSFNCVDFIDHLNNYPMDGKLYTAQRSDQIIEDILNELGFGTSEYVLDTGLNTIGYAWFAKGSTAGARIKEICEAEEGYFYQDEDGVLRFENRNHFGVAPHTASVWNIQTGDIIKWEDDESTPIYNKVTVKATPRTAQALQNIWIDSIEEVVLGGGKSIEVWANLSDPASSVTSPAATTDFTAFTGTGGTGSNITADQVISIDNFNTAVKITITNNNASTAYYNLLKLRGTPLIVTGELIATATDDVSVNNYGERALTLTNNFIQSESYVFYLATIIKDRYADPTKRLILTIQGIPQLQLRDRIQIYDLDKNFKTYFVMRIQGNYTGGLFTQKVYLRETSDYELDSYTKLLLHFDGEDGDTKTVDSATNKAVTFVGTAQLDTAQKKFGNSSLLLDGNSDIVSLADSDDWNFGREDFTFECQARLNSVGAGFAFFEQYVSATVRGYFYWNTTNLSFYVKNTDVLINMLRAWTPVVNTTYHVALVRSGNNFKIFIDGVQLGADEVADITMPDFSSAFWIGRTNGGNYFNGWIDEVRISKGIARWTTDFTPPTIPYRS